MAIPGLAFPDPFNPYGWAYQQTHTPDEAANAKARGLLRDKLSKAQRRCFDRHGFFFVISVSGKRYKIESYLIKYIEDGEREIHLCVYPTGNMPIYDKMLAMKLHVETNEDELLKTANKF